MWKTFLTSRAKKSKRNHAYLFVDIVVITKKHDARIPNFIRKQGYNRLLHTKVTITRVMFSFNSKYFTPRIYYVNHKLKNGGKKHFPNKSISFLFHG